MDSQRFEKFGQKGKKMSFNELLKKSLALVEKHEKVEEKKVNKDNDKILDQFLEWETLSLQTQYKLVSEEVEKNWHFPTSSPPCKCLRNI